MTKVLKKVSRSLYLSLRILPKRLRWPLSLAYLLARAADTITDTAVIAVHERRRWLQFFRQCLLEEGQVSESWGKFRQALVGPQEIPEEHLLLQNLGSLVLEFWQLPVEDRSDIQEVMAQLMSGMEQDLDYFVGSLKALSGWEDLDRYCHFAAGVVGPFWTRMTFRHVPSLRRYCHQSQMEGWGERFGRGLQLINVLKDVAKDLRNGRCYLPNDGLVRLCLTPQDLLNPQSQGKVQPLLQQAIQKSLEYLGDGERYVEALPRRHPLLRLASLWPLWIGLETLRQLGLDVRLLDPDRSHKITRSTLKRLLLKSFRDIFSNRRLATHYRMGVVMIQSS